MTGHRLVVLLLMLLASIATAQSNPIPLVNQPLIPASVAPGHRGFILAVSGTGFVSGAVVRWNGHDRLTSFQSSSSLQAKISAADVAETGTASVTVTNPSPGGGSSNTVYFPIRLASSSITTTMDTAFTATASVRAVADFNNDGKPDIAVADKVSGGIAVYLSNGDGTFQPALISRPGVFFNALLPGDFNGDGKPDLAATFPFLCNGCGGYPSYNLIIYLGDGGGHFKAVIQPKRRAGWPLVAADFDGDGTLDLLTISPSYDGSDWYPLVYLGNGNGTLRKLEYGALGDTHLLGIPSVGDFNGDGKLDLAMPALDYTNGLPQLNVALGNGDGSFQNVVSYAGPFLNGGYAVATADVNGDGKLDMVFDTGNVFLGNGDGTFTLDQNSNVEGAYLAGITVADMNADSKLDIVTNGLNYFGSNLVLLGNNDGTFQPLAVTGSGTILGVADFNGDGALDVLTSTALFLQTP